MTYVPREPRLLQCIQCQEVFIAPTLARKYCSNSCNVLASNARKRAREAAEAAAAAVRTDADSSPEETNPAPDFLLPRRLLRLASPMRALEAPRELHRSETFERLGWDFLIQKYESTHLLHWLHTPSEQVYSTRHFWVGEDASVWVECLPHGRERLTPVDDLVPCAPLVPQR